MNADIAPHPKVVELGLDQRMTREEIALLPIQAYEGPVELVQTPEAADAAAARLMQDKVLGFDTETRPTFQKGQYYPPALIQLGGAREVCVFQLKKTGLTPGLKVLLESSRVIKTGVSMAYDVKTLKDHGEFDAAGFVDIGDVARAWGIPNHGLRPLAAQFLQIRISKSSQRSNWDSDPLKPKQIIYAATDAWISYEIYKHFERLDLLNPPPLPPPKEKKKKPSASSTAAR